MTLTTVSGQESQRSGACAEAIDALADVVGREFQASPYPAMRGLRCVSDGGSLTLEGRVRSFFLKQMAQALVSRLAGGVAVENRIEVLV